MFVYCIDLKYIMFIQAQPHVLECLQVSTTKDIDVQGKA